MQAERVHLRTHVFPELEERLKALRCHLEWVDLRLGVASAAHADVQARELQILKACLAEVQRCRPFLIVLLGDRYGWVPPADRVATAGFGADAFGRSVTDLEIWHGVLADPTQQPRSFFYFREPLPYRDMPRDIAALYSDVHDTRPGASERTEKLTSLKRQIEELLPKRVRRYSVEWDKERQTVTGLEAWGRTVLEAIWSDLLAVTPPPEREQQVSWQQAERDALEDYVEDRARDFVGREAILARLAAIATSPAEHAPTWGALSHGWLWNGQECDLWRA